MASQVNKYRLWCATEEAWKEVWDEQAPTHCPDNTDHTINTNSIVIEDSISLNEVVIKEENTPTGGHYQAQGVALNIPSGTGYTNTDISFPHPISLMTANFTHNDDMKGDEGEFIVAPDTVVGVLTQTATSGVSIFSVSSTAITNMFVGCKFALYNGVNKDDCGRVIAINPASGTITVETPCTHAFSAGTTYVLMSINLLRNSILAGEGRVQLGECKIGGSYIPSNTIIRARYKNNNGIAKTVIVFIEYLY